MIIQPFKLFQLINSFHQSPEKLEKTQKKRLHDILSYAFENVEYWKEIKTQLPPEVLGKVLKGDLGNFPIITKSIFRQRPREDFISKRMNPDRCNSVRTSGATGIPFEMLKSPAESRLMELIFTRAMYLSGCGPFDSQMTICCPYDFHKSYNLLSIFRLKKKVSVSAFLPPEELVEEINRLKPKVIRAYASTLTLLSRFIRKKNLEFHPPKLIISGSDLLTKEQRKNIEEVMKSPVIDFYGTVETGNIAFECRKCGEYHINSDFLVCEFLKDGKPAKDGESGSIVVTSLFHRAKPLIRYDIGDCGEPSYNNRCSSTNMLSMKNLQGRTVDFLILPDDREVSPYTLTDTIKSVHSVEEFQAIQENKEELLIQVATREENKTAIAREVEEKIRKVLGPDIKIHIEFVNELEKHPGQKYRVVTSRVPR